MALDPWKAAIFGGVTAGAALAAYAVGRLLCPKPKEQLQRLQEKLYEANRYRYRYAERVEELEQDQRLLDIPAPQRFTPCEVLLWGIKHDVWDQWDYGAQARGFWQLEKQCRRMAEGKPVYAELLRDVDDYIEHHTGD